MLLTCKLTRHGRNTQTRRVTLPSVIFYSEKGNTEGKKWDVDTQLYLYPEVDKKGSISLIVDNTSKTGYPCHIVKTVSGARQLTIPYQILYFLGWNETKSLRLDWVDENRIMFMKGE